MIRIPGICILAMAIWIAGCKQEGQEGPAGVSETYLGSVIEEIASDAYLGRKPFTEGETKTIQYLKEELEQMGLKPGNGSSYYQEVPLVSIDGKPSQELVIRGDHAVFSFQHGEEFTAGSQREVEAVGLEDSELVFCGYGIVAPEYNWNDYAGIDMRGKTAVVLVNDPGFGSEDSTFFKGNTMTYYGRWTYKYEEAERQGAAGILIIHETASAGYPWFVVKNGWTGAQLYLQSKGGNMTKPAIEGWISLDAAKRLFAAAKRDLGAQIRAARKATFEPVPLNLTASVTVEQTLKEDVSNNVIGVLEGTERPDEYIIFSAHWDHLGVGNVVDGDSIYNGAVDNATGTACILSIAKAMAENPVKPERSVVFLFVTAEEQGLLGSAWYAEHPIFPPEKTVANLNMDGMHTYGPMNDLQVIGFGQSELDDYARAAAEKQGRYIIPDTEPEKGYFFRSDHFSFAKVGIPALYAEGGSDHQEKGKDYAKAMSTAYRTKDYHQPSDEYRPEEWDLSGLVQDADLYLDIAWRLANEETFPRWKEGSEFKALRD